MKKYREDHIAAVRSIHQQDARQAAAIADDPSWHDLLGPLLTIEEVQQRAGIASRLEIEAMVRRRQLLALMTGTGLAVFPAFQFDGQGIVYPWMQQIIGIFDGIVVTPYTIASWLKGPKEYLGGLTPLRWLELGREIDPVLAGAEAAAARLAH